MLQSRAGKAHGWLKTESCPGGARARCHSPGVSGLIHTHVLGSASAGPGGWHSPGPKPGHTRGWWCQRGAPVQGKAQHGPELHPLLEHCDIWVCFRHLGGFWTVEVCYLLPGVLFDFCLLNGGQSADTTMEIEVEDAAAPVWRGKVSSAQTREPVLPYFTPTWPLDFSLAQISPHKTPDADYHLDQNQDGERRDFTLQYYSSWVCMTEENG